jgi:pyruvate kinase
VTPLLIGNQSSTSRTFTLAMGVAQQEGLLREGDLVVQTAGTLTGVSGSPDLVKVGIVSAVLGRGVGFGTRSVCGQVRLATSPEEAARLEPGEILVVSQTSAPYLEAIRRAGGLITEEPGSQSHAAVIAQRLGIPVIVGVNDVTRDVRDGEVVTLDVRQGVVHRGTHVLDSYSVDSLR